MAEGFKCAVEERFRSACKDLSRYQNTQYCVLHYPEPDKDEEHFLNVKNDKLGNNHDYDFGGAVFPEGTSDFRRRTFFADVTFAGATFHGKAAFSKAIFSGEANFREATFKGEADFYKAEFKETGKEEAKEALEASKEALKNAREKEGRNAKGEAEEAKEAKEAAEQATRAKKAVEEAEHKVSKKRDADFVDAVFEEEGNYEKAIFSGEAYFRRASFRGEADFSKAEFIGEARFREATFKEKGDFAEANFAKEAGFRNATFEKEASFTKTIFKQEAKFRRTVFQGFVEFKGPSKFKGPSNEDRCETHTFNKRANFSAAKFEERAVFVGQCTFDTKQDEATFRNTLIEKPENFSFDRVWLRPSWFIDTNVQQFRFTNVRWRGLPGGPPGRIEEEIEAIKNRRERKEEVEEEDEEEEKEDIQIGYPPDVLAKTCRELSANAEENRDYPTANEFHYWSMELLRKESWWKRLGLIGSLYWALSGYGERPRRAFGVLVGMWAFFALCYMLTGHQDLQVAVQAFSGADIRQGIEHAWKALVYSLAAIARLNPEPKPSAPGVFQLLVTAEGLLGPLQIALLALAIRRKVMR